VFFGESERDIGFIPFGTLFWFSLTYVYILVLYIAWETQIEEVIHKFMSHGEWNNKFHGVYEEVLG
jgi:hypothetical protein